MATSQALRLAHDGQQSVIANRTFQAMERSYRSSSNVTFSKDMIQTHMRAKSYAAKLLRFG